MTIDKEVHDWLYDDLDGLKEKIVFKDRTEYRINGKLHNHKGPALIRKTNNFKILDDNSNEEYYLNGVKLEKEQWDINIRKYKIDRLIKKSKNKEDGK